MSDTEPSQVPEKKTEEETRELPRLPRVRMRYSTYAVIVGFLIFLLGAKPEFFGMNISPVVGFVQISVMIIGLGIVCLSGYWLVHALWRGTTPSIAADIGLRLVSTGYVIIVFSGLADVFGIGSQPPPMVPFFGVWQARGMDIGLGVVAMGFILMFPYHKLTNNSTDEPHHS